MKANQSFPHGNIIMLTAATVLLALGCDLEQPPDDAALIANEAVGDYEQEQDPGETSKKTLCVEDECVDGVADLSLRYYLSNDIELRTHPIEVGRRLRVFGHEFLCGDSPCSTSWTVVQRLNSGKLVAAQFGNPVPGRGVAGPLWRDPRDLAGAAGRRHHGPGPLRALRRRLRGRLGLPAWLARPLGRLQARPVRRRDQRLGAAALLGQRRRLAARRRELPARAVQRLRQHLPGRV